MKDSKYYVLKIISENAKKHGSDFISTNILNNYDLSQSFLTHLEFCNYLEYKRENKEDLYKVSPFGMEYLYQHKRENLNLVLSFIAAISSILGIILTLTLR